MTATRHRFRWQSIRRGLGIAIVLGVLAGWELGRSISDPGVLMLLGIACGLLSINIYVNAPRVDTESGSTRSSSEPPSDSSEKQSSTTSDRP